MYHAFLSCYTAITVRCTSSDQKDTHWEREQQAKAVGNRDHFIKIYLCVCMFLFKAVALSMSTTVYSPPPSLSVCNLDVPPYSSDTGLWSFKAITMALEQAFNWINLFLFKKKTLKQQPSSPPSPPQSPVTTLPAHCFSQPPLSVKRAAWFRQASNFLGWQLRLLSMESLQAVWEWQIGPLSVDIYLALKAKKPQQTLKTKCGSCNFYHHPTIWSLRFLKI